MPGGRDNPTGNSIFSCCVVGLRSWLQSGAAVQQPCQRKARGDRLTAVSRAPLKEVRVAVHNYPRRNRARRCGYRTNTVSGSDGALNLIDVIKRELRVTG